MLGTTGRVLGCADGNRRGVWSGSVGARSTVCRFKLLCSYSTVRACYRI
jgi:hypothetical protein